MLAKSMDVEVVIDPPADAKRRLRRLRWLAWLMDRSIPIGGGRRIGLDPVLGLIPGLGDWLGAAVSTLLVYDAIRLGLPVSVLARMMLNIVIEAAVGAVPVLGDIFDAVWQANQRNLRLVERHYDPRLQVRSVRALTITFLIIAGVSLIGAAALIWLAFHLIWLAVKGGG